jgi:hypothetical protein
MHEKLMNGDYFGTKNYSNQKVLEGDELEK